MECTTGTLLDAQGAPDAALGFGRRHPVVREFDGEGTIVLVCAQGLLSAQIAERMQEAGLEAYSLRGGDRALRRELAVATVGPTSTERGR